MTAELPGLSGQPSWLPQATAPPSPNSAIDPSSMQAIGTSMVTAASNFMGSLMNAANFTPPVINPDLPKIATAPQPVTANLPSLINVAWNTPNAPAGWSTPAPSISQYLPGLFTGTAPAVHFGTAPTPDFGTPPPQPAVDLNFTYPTLSLNIPAAPSLLAINSIPFGGVTLPTFSGTMPALTLTPPSILAYGPETPFTSLLLTSLAADLNDAITTGKGLVVGGVVENALWDAAREREYRAQAAALAGLDQMEGLGYSLPPGVYVDARIKIQTETDNTITGLSREIMVQQAKDMLENLKQARAAATELEGKQMEYANQVAQRVFDSCKLVAETSVQIYNAGVEAYKAQLDGYRTQAQVFETLLKGAQTQVEIYKAELEGEKLKVDVNSSMVAQYSELIKAQTLFVDIYKAELGAIETQANLQKIVVEAYGEEIKAFVGKVQAYTAEVDAYKASLETQQVVTSIFKTQVEAYAAEVQAGVGMSNATIEGYKAQISAYTTQLDYYRTQIQAMGEQAKAASEYNQAQASVYSAEMGAISSYNTTITEQWKAVATINEQQADIAIKALESNATIFVQSKNVAVEALKGGAQVAAQIGSAALNAIHWSQSSSWSSSISNSMAESWSTSVSAADSYSETKSV